MNPATRFAVRFTVAAFASIVSLFSAELPAADALVRAVKRNEPAAWSALLAQKSDVKIRDAGGNTALHHAALNHDLAAVRALLAAGAEADATNAADATPLHYGAGHAEIVRALLAKGANANAVSALKSTPLMIAVAHPESYDAARLLIQAGANVRATRDGENEVVLNIAVTGGDQRTVELLLARGADKSQRAVSVALATASFTGEAALVRLLIEAGGDPNFDGGGAGHALNRALYGAHPEVADFLIEKGASLDVRSTSGHSTPTMVWTAYNQTGDPSLARKLVTAGADVNAANAHGMTALAYALRSGTDTPLVRYLRSVGAKAPEHPRTRKIPDRPVPAAAAERAEIVRARMPATLALLQKSSDAFLDNGFVQQTKCTSCHGQDMPPVAYELARARGFKIDDASLGRSILVQTARWNGRAENARQMIQPVPGAPIALAYGLFGLRAANYAADDMTEAMVRYILRTQKADGHWGDFTRRPPMEDGSYVATGWVPLSIRDYAPAGYERAAAAAQQRAVAWLTREKPVNHNEAVFQLLGLHWAGEPSARVEKFVDGLIHAQRPDGGWAQLPALESDAWATGAALYALHKAEEMKPTDAVYQRGVAFLLRTQYEDGSWWVKSRAWPFQPHFNGQFPHGKDQWISQGATAWAAMALLFTLDPVQFGLPPPTAPELMATYERSPLARRQKTDTRPAVAAGAESAVTFARDIKPILDRSCAGCHDGQKPRAAFVVTSRDLLLKGGASGEPAIAPGYADDSLLIDYVTGKIEDLEMPPLDRREKYPPLSAPEIDLLRRWIDAGAPAGAVKTASTTPARE